MPDPADDSDSESGDESMPEGCDDYLVTQSFSPADQVYVIGEPEVVIDLDTFVSEQRLEDCWEYNMYIVDDQLPSDDKSAIILDRKQKTATIYSTKESSAGEYQVAIAIVDKSTAER